MRSFFIWWPLNKVQRCFCSRICQIWNLAQRSYRRHWFYCCSVCVPCIDLIGDASYFMIFVIFRIYCCAAVQSFCPGLWAGSLLLLLVGNTAVSYCCCAGICWSERLRRLLYSCVPALFDERFQVQISILIVLFRQQAGRSLAVAYPLRFFCLRLSSLSRWIEIKFLFLLDIW